MFANQPDRPSSFFRTVSIVRNVLPRRPGINLFTSFAARSRVARRRVSPASICPVQFHVASIFTANLLAAHKLYLWHCRGNQPVSPLNPAAGIFAAGDKKSPPSAPCLGPPFAIFPPCYRLLGTTSCFCFCAPDNEGEGGMDMPISSRSSNKPNY